MTVITEKYIYQVESLEHFKTTKINFAFRIVMWKVEFKIGCVI